MSDETIRQIAEKYAQSLGTLRVLLIPDCEGAIREAVALARQQAIEECAKAVNVLAHDPQWTGKTAMLSNIAASIRALPVDSPNLARQQQWIPVSEKLPEHTNTVLISHDFRTEGVLCRHCNGSFVWIAWWDGKNWRRSDGLSDDPVLHANITHWQPLPNPPQ